MTTYAVRVSFMETNYVEREFIVEAGSPAEAQELAITGGVFDEGDEIICSPEDRTDLKLALEYTGLPYEPVAIEELE